MWWKQLMFWIMSWNILIKLFKLKFFRRVLIWPPLIICVGGSWLKKTWCCVMPSCCSLRARIGSQLCPVPSLVSVVLAGKSVHWVWGGGSVPERLYEVWIKSDEGARAVFEMCSVMGICLGREAWSIVLGRHSELWSALLLCQSISTSSPVCTHSLPCRRWLSEGWPNAIWIYYDAC